MKSNLSGNVHEQEVNQKIAAILNKKGNWKAMSERTGRVVGKKSMRPDIIVEIDGSAVVVETEYHPAAELNTDVLKTFGEEIVGLGRPTAIVGIILPVMLKHCNENELNDVITKQTDFQYYIQHMDGSTFPTDGYLRGSITDIMAAIHLSSIPWERIEKCVEMMKNGIQQISYKLKYVNSAIQDDICFHIRQKPSQQTWNMASLVLLNAGIFYEELASHRNDVTPTEKIRILGILDQSMAVRAWDDVLANIDYIPIFKNAVEILRSLPSGVAADILDIISKTVSRVMAMKVSKSGDVYGLLYQSMLTDRRNVAAYYTRPEAATLLASLVMPTSNEDIWQDENRIRGLRIADFACGTGMLLTAAYSYIIDHAPYDAAAMHSHIMEKCLYGYDILPTATHLTVSNLAGLFSDKAFDWTNIYTMPIGKVAGGSGYNLGSLDIIKDSVKFVKAGERHGGHGTRDTKMATIQHNSCDYIVMNPPYVRATNHGGGRTDPVPPFAVFGILPKEQLEMADINKKLYSNTCSHGHAGLASYFMAICDKKLKPGGVMGLILPSTIASGSSWSKIRIMMNEWYDDVTLISVGFGDGTYSSDTSMNEIMLIASKLDVKRIRSSKPLRIKLALVDKMPESRLMALEIAKKIKSTQPVRLEDDAGHTSIQIGRSVVGRMLDCPVEDDRWWAGRISDTSLLQFVYSLEHNKTSIPMTTLGKLADIGRHHLDIIGYKKDGGPQGPFNKVPLAGKPKWTCLWNNNGETQRAMTVEPDCALEKKYDASMEHINTVWSTATRLHINYQILYSSQRLVAAYTNNVTIGGRSWPNVILNESYAKAFMVWCNSVFGIMMYWSVAGSQQPGRGIMSRIAFKTTFPVLNFNELSKKQIVQFNRLFDKNRMHEMLPINHLDEDLMRQELDRGILDILDVEIDLDTIYDHLIRELQFNRSNA